MKRNVAMRMAGILLVLVLITMSFVGSTLGKYVADESGEDSARIAKWGVTVEMTGDGAGDGSAQENDDGSLTSTASSGTAAVAAPGTNGTFTGVSVSGTPEVAVSITKTAAVTVTGWFINEGEFYCPITVTVNGTAISGLDYSGAEELAAAIDAAIEVGGGQYDAGTDLSGISGLSGELTWEWAYEADGTEQTDEKDTKLAQLSEKPSISVEIEVHVEQIS